MFYNSLTNLLHVYYFFGHPTHPACHRGLNEDLVRDPQNLEISWYLVVASIASTFLKQSFPGVIFDPFWCSIQRRKWRAYFGAILALGYE